MSNIQHDIRLMRASSGASMLASLLLILLLYKLRLKQSTSDSKIKSKNINYIMTIIAVTNLLLAASIFIGQPHDGTFLCWIQAVTTNYFCLVHIFWSTMLAYTLFKAAKDLTSTNVFSKLFIALGFVFPMVITLLPLTTNNYGNPDADRGWCFLDDRDDSPNWTRHFWMWFSFYFWLFSAMVMSIAFLVVSFSILSANVVTARTSAGGARSTVSSFLGDEFATQMMKSVNKIAGYPIIILVCWGPSLVYDLLESSSTSNKRIVDIGNFFFPGLQGLLVTLVFMITNREAKSYVSDFGVQMRSMSTNAAADNLKFDEECYDVDEPDFIVNPSDFRRTDVKSVPRESSMVSNPIVNK